MKIIKILASTLIILSALVLFMPSPVPVFAETAADCANRSLGFDPATQTCITAGGNEGNGGSLICTIFPFIQGIDLFGANFCGDAQTAGEQAANQSVRVVNLVLQLIFVGIIIISIYIIIKAAIKYIQSEGDEAKIKDAQKAIKSVFVGIAALIIGIVGVFIVLAFFQAGGALNPTGGTPIDVNNPTNLLE